jgi:ribosomal protein L11 methylase PrmA
VIEMGIYHAAKAQYDEFGQAYHDKREDPSRSYFNTFVDVPAMTEVLQGVVGGKRVLDLGCGSGILGVAAAKMGATDVWALDIDDMAVRSTAENAERNNVRHHLTTVKQGSLAEVLDKPDYFELILVNILAKIIIPMCEQGLGSIV